MVAVVELMVLFSVILLLVLVRAVEVLLPLARLSV